MCVCVIDMCVRVPFWTLVGHTALASLFPTMMEVGTKGDAPKESCLPKLDPQLRSAG